MILIDDGSPFVIGMDAFHALRSMGFGSKLQIAAT